MSFSKLFYVWVSLLSSTEHHSEPRLSEKRNIQASSQIKQNVEPDRYNTKARTLFANPWTCEA